MEVAEKFNLTGLSNELLCHIFSFLPLREVLRIGMLNKKLLAAVKMHLLLCKEIDFCQGEIFGYMPIGIKDKNLAALLNKCPNLETIYGLHPLKVERWRLRRLSALSIPGIIEALYLCPLLKKVETSNLRLLEVISQYLPQVEIIGCFRNRDGVFPPQSTQQLKLSPFLRISTVHLIGVQVPELTVMPELQYLYLQWVSFTRLHPFRAFSAPKLKTFVMRHCIGPSLPLRYYALFMALGLAPDLSRLELVRVPLLGGMINRTVEELLRERGFQKLRKLVLGDCKGMMESDVGQLMIAASQSLESLSVQASLTKDSLFVSLHFAHCDFSRVKSLHLGYVDDFPPKDEWSNDILLGFGLVDVPDVPSSITDSGMKFVSQLFPNATELTISNCPHIIDARAWIAAGHSMWENLTNFTLERCHCLRLTQFTSFLAELKSIEVLVLKNMFREPPKGCSHVGLSAGTGLGLSSAIVSTQDEHIAVQGHQIEAIQDNEEGGDQHIANNENINPAMGIEMMGNLPLVEQEDVEQQNLSRASSDQEMEPPDHNGNSPPEKHLCSVRRSSRLRSAAQRSLGCSKLNSKISKRSVSSNEPEAVASGSNDGSFTQRRVKRRKIDGTNSKCGKSSCPCSSRGRSSKVQTNTGNKNHQSDDSDDEQSNERPKGSRAQGGKATTAASNYEGPVTRNRRKMLTTSRGCKRTCCSKGTQTVTRSAPQSLSYRASSDLAAVSQTSKQRFYSSKESEAQSKSKMCDKATSTSDPLLEDDVTQVFPVVSHTLKSLTIISCGISELVMHECPSLLHLEAQGCRILKGIFLCLCPQLTRLSISGCPKMDIPFFISEVMNTDHENALLVYIKPFLKNYSYSVSDIQCHALIEAIPQHALALFHDFSSSDDDDRAASQEHLLNLLRLMKHLSLHIKSWASENIYSGCSDKYPWGHNVQKFLGKFHGGNYDLVTNNSLLAALWRESSSIKDLQEQNAFMASKISQLASAFKFDIAEFVESGFALSNRFVGFYIHVSETNIVN